MTTHDSDLADLVLRLGEPRVLVVGDVMLDRYVWGDAARISQEAPVILLQADKREERLGGASSVAMMLRALGAKVQLAGVVGDDGDGLRIRGIVRDLGISDEAMLVDPSRPSTVKERYIGRAQHRHPQQMIRVDYEVRHALDAATESRLADAIRSLLPQSDIVLVSDYDKGVCSPGLLARVIADAKRAGKKVVADPIRGGDYEKYRGCSAITPNRLEAGLATKRTIVTLTHAVTSGRELRERLDLDAAIITLDRDGMMYVGGDGEQHHPTRPRQVYDITGAGDMVMAVLGMALAAGAEYGEAIRLANVAGGLEVEKIGVATVTREEMLADIMHGGGARTASKVVTMQTIAAEVERHRAVGRRIAFTNGCFDVLHAGHVQYLYEARAQADLLVVGLNSDASVSRLKGPTRPVNAAAERMLVLAALEPVDVVTVFEEATPLELIKLVKPDVLVKGADYRREQVVGGDFVEGLGGRVHLAGLRDGFSTTRLLQRLGAA